MAPQAFENCRRNGGKIRTKTLSGGRYMHICFLGGKSYPGEVKKKDSGGAGESNVAKAIERRMG